MCYNGSSRNISNIGTEVLVVTQKYENLTREQLLKLVEKIETPRRYGLVWEEGHIEETTAQHENDYPYLEYIHEKSIISSEDATNHVLIDGDNYYALQVLNESLGKKVDLIYIDPPYNIGRKEFVYNDDFVDKTNAYKHSKWLSFMEKRLRLAKNLLKEDGCIFISINEEEVAQLKLLCDEVFSEQNYMTMFTIKVRHEDRILTGDKDFQEVVEYLLMYRASEQFKVAKIKKDNTSYDAYMYDVQLVGDQPIEQTTWEGKKVKIFSEGQYKITKRTPSEELLKRYNIRGTLRTNNSSGRFYVNHIEPLYKDKPGYLFKVENIGDDGLRYRYFLSPPKGRGNGDYFQGVPQKRSDVKEVPYPNYFDFEKEFNKVGYEGGVEFKNGKKPIAFLMKIFEVGGLIEKENAIVLDFFAGSGSTAHALMEFNEVHQGKRKAIICQKNEETKIRVIDEVTYPRMKNIIEGYTIQRKEQILLEEMKITKQNMQKCAELLEDLEEKRKHFHKINLFDEVVIEFEQQLLKLIGVRKKNYQFKGVNANLQYFKVDFIHLTTPKPVSDHIFDILNC